MVQYSDRLHWSASVPGSWTIRLTATDPAGISSYADVSLVVSPNRPPTISAPSSISATAPAAVDVAIGVVDPEGGAVTVTATGAPAGIQITATRIYWSSSVAGSWTIRITAKDSAGKTSYRDVSLVVGAPTTKAAVTFQWIVRPEDRYYYLSAYNTTTSTWALRQYASGGSCAVTLDRARYNVTLHRWTATSTSWQVVGSKTFDAAGTMTVTLP